MRFIELMRLASEWSDDDTTIYVSEPWSCEAYAILVSPAPDTTEAIERVGIKYDYVLETFIAREFAEDFAASEDGASAIEREHCERLIRYARDDT